MGHQSMRVSICLVELGSHLLVSLEKRIQTDQKVFFGGGGGEASKPRGDVTFSSHVADGAQPGWACQAALTPHPAALYKLADRRA